MIILVTLSIVSCLTTSFCCVHFVICINQNIREIYQRARVTLSTSMCWEIAAPAVGPYLNFWGWWCAWKRKRSAGFDGIGVDRDGSIKW